MSSDLNDSPVSEETLAATDESQIETVQDSATEEIESESQTGSTVQDENSEDSDTESDKPKKGFQRRIEKAKAQARAEAQAELNYWKQVAIQNGVKAPETQHAAVNNEKPLMSQYSSVEEFAEAIADWKIDQRLTQREVAKEQSKVATSYTARVTEFLKTTPDFHEVLNDASDVPMSPEIGEVCMESDVGPKLAYYLANNIDEVERINALPQGRRYVELGKLEAKLADAGASTKKTVVSKAPAPITPVTGSKKGAATNSNLYETAASMDYKDFAKARAAQLAARKK